jgi:ring-1,2-phenylacetyl-CoA epoxidase subunit PaaE
MNHSFYSLTVEKVRKESPDAITLIFQKHTAFENYLAGQFLTLRANIHGEDTRRAYSLCASPALNEAPSVTIKKVSGGKMSTWLFENAHEGMQLDVMPAIGNFVYQPNATKRRWFMLFAAGSGITPIFSIIKTILIKEPQSYVSLLFGNRCKEDIIYFSELEELRNRYPSRLKVIHTLSKPDSTWFGETGRISEQKIMELIEDLKPISPFEETQVYMCGPAEMMDAISPVIMSQGVKSENLHREQFSRKLEDLLSQAKSESVFEEQSMVRILLDGKWHEIAVSGKSSILDAALDNGLDMPYSCQSGLCTACRGKCTKGKVRMDETEGLSDEELEEGYVLTCVGHAASSEVEIEIG